MVLVLLPWTGGTPPPGVLAPRTADADGVLCDAEIQRAAASRHTVLVPCTFEHPEEEAAANRILPQFTTCEHVCVFIVQLMPDGMVPSRATADLIMRRHDAMLATSVDDVFMDPDLGGEGLRSTINLAR